MAEEPSESEQTRSTTRATFFHRHSSHHSASDPYDHEISLVDTTSRSLSRSPAPPANDSAGEPSDTENLERRRTRLKQSVRRNQNDWKYRKYQKGRCAEDEEADVVVAGALSNARQSRDTYGTSTLRRKYGEVRDRIPVWQQKKQRAQAKKLEEYEIDILYENQRGSFFCGIPLYSSKSLLNFDPAPWQTSEFKESPVNITNAQPPDPTWIWAWKTWYVDMSHDVDEEGWEYSFSFRQGFAWHGTHPWFHSWVRRRRWLRKRVKVDPKAQKGGKESMHEAHKLNLDYFTIHSTPRERSPNPAASSVPTSQRYSTVLANRHEDEDDAEEDISNMPALLKALKKATVDRRKLAAVKAFIVSGGQELHYLAENMPEVLDMCVYQTSRRHILAELQRAASRSKEDQEAAESGKGKEVATTSETEPSTDSAAMTKALEQAIRAAQDKIQDYEYWSDLKATVKDAEVLNVPPPPPGGPDVAPRDGVPYPLKTENNEPPGTVIKGIPQSAGIGKNVGIAERVAQQRQAEESSTGKGKEKEQGPKD